MSTPLNDFKAYLEQYPDLNTLGYNFARGRWYEDNSSANERFIVIRQSGSSRPVRSLRYITVQVLIVGKRDEGATTEDVEEFANSLHNFVQSAKTGCSIVSVSTLTDVVGPSYTEHDRPVYELNLQMIYQTEEI